MNIPFMIILEKHNWLWITIIFGLLLMFSLIMKRQSLNFYTKDVVPRKFSIMELEIPATSTELFNLIKGLYLLPEDQSIKSIRSLRSQLILDFLFMPFVYLIIFLLCWKIAHKMQLSFGYSFFIALAFLQLIPWICDIIKNCYLLNKIKKEVLPSSEEFHRNYLWMEGFKWGITLIAAISAISVICYFWLTGNYSSNSLYYLLIVLSEIIIFIGTNNLLFKSNQINKTKNSK